MDNLIYLSTIVLGLVGFLVALNIYHKKRCQKPMTCPLNMKCEQVLYSKYAKFLGVPIELLGMIYYGIVVFSYSIIIFIPTLKSPLLIASAFVVSVCGFIFSGYLTSIQLLKLKEFCSWCLMSAVISTTIFALTSQVSSLSSNMNALADNYKFIMVVTYAVVVSLGLLVAVTMEILFFKFLRDSRMSKRDASLMHHLRQMTWLALGIMTVSNFAIQMSNWKILILAALIIANGIYDLLISSRLIELLSNDRSRENSSSYLKKMPLIFGPLCLFLWFLIFILEMID